MHTLRHRAEKSSWLRFVVLPLVFNGLFDSPSFTLAFLTLHRQHLLAML